MAISAILLLLALGSISNSIFAAPVPTISSVVTQGLSTFSPATTLIPAIDLENGYRYLEDNLNPSLNLIRESPDTGSPQDTTYWLATDNLLASYALKNHNPLLSASLMSSIEGYGYNRTTDHYAEILFGIPTVEPIYAVDGYRTILKTDSYQILTDNITGNLMSDYDQYLDKLCYETLWYAYKGSRTQAETLYSQALAKWDGKGFVDKASSPNNYATFKLAIFYYTAKVLGHLDTLTFKDTLLSIMSGLQAPNGGFRTAYYYDGNGILQSQSSTNTETTSLVLIALNYVLYGDANMDGVINMGDVTKIERIILGLDPSIPGTDANRDGMTNMGDVTKVERLILGLDLT